jgi:hypothetical protein
VLLVGRITLPDVAESILEAGEADAILLARQLFADPEWPQKVRVMQTNWIGRSMGAEVDFPVVGMPDEQIRIYTTRPDTLFGATFMVLAPEHALVDRVTTAEHRARVHEYVEKARKETEIERLSTDRDKTGVATGGYATNPLNGEKIPIWVADYVLVTYGTGAIMAVPAHDERDFEFAIRYDLPVREVIAPPVVHRACSGRPTSVRARWSQRAVRRPRRRRRLREDLRLSRVEGHRQACGEVPPARLADLPPALLGRAHPGRLLPDAWHRAGAQGPVAGALAQRVQAPLREPVLL